MKRRVRISQKKRQRRTVNSFESSYDPLGSYTGICDDDKYAIPTQDADDL